MNEVLTTKQRYIRNIAAFLLVLFCIQYIPVESRAGVSYVKFAAACSCPLVWLAYSQKTSRVMMLSAGYMFCVIFAALCHPNTLRWSTILYLASFLVMFSTFYNLIYEEKAFSFEFFTRLITGLLLAYFITLLMQQACLSVGIRTFPPINLVQILNRNIGSNSLSYEPSSAARIMAVLYLALMKMQEIRLRRKIRIADMWRDYKWPTLAFLWSMLTMGSGTAFVALGILSLYFIQKRYLLTVVPLLVMFVMIIPYIDFEPLQRAYNVLGGFLTGDEQAVQKDTSAAVRVQPLINTFMRLDLTQWETWLGHGCDFTVSQSDYFERLKISTIGGINEYGLLSFLIMQLIIFKCVIRRFVSLETVIWFSLFGMSFGNIPYTWGAMMVFATVSYFQSLRKNASLISELK